MLLAASISFNSEIISLYSCCAKKGLVYIVIMAFFNCQLSFYLKYIKVNTYFFCNMRSVSNNKYIFILSSNIHDLPQLLGGNT